MNSNTHQPDRDCPSCPRLCAFRNENKIEYSEYYNGPVPSFGGIDARVLVVGLAPGLHGANASGRPFTGDYAGVILYPALLKHGLARGAFHAPAGTPRVMDSLELVNTRITNAVRCVPPANKPETDEIKRCNAFLTAELRAMPNLQVVLTLGNVAHAALLRALGLKPKAAQCAHGAHHTLPGPHGPLVVINSYHTSRYNINTGRLTPAMFDAVMADVAACVA